MKRITRYASIICCVALACLFGLLTLDEKGPHRLAKTWGRIHRSFGQNFKVAEGIKLYAEPDTRTDEERKFENDYPEIFATRSVVVIFGAEWCQWCKAEGKELTEPSKTYDIIYRDIEAPDDKWGLLMERWNLGSSIPVTVIVERGKVVKTFSGFTNWDAIQPHCEKAKKNEDQSTGSFKISPLDGSMFGDVDLRNRERNKRRY